jgi:hypothetical protein
MAETQSIYEQDLDDLIAKIQRLNQRSIEGKAVAEYIPVHVDLLINMLEDLGRL